MCGFYEPYANQFIRTYTGDKLMRLEAKNGGAIMELLKADAPHTPTLILGLGGLGGRAMNQIKKKYIKCINDPQGYIQFLAMDFDRMDLDNLLIAERDGWLKCNEICNMLANPGALVFPMKEDDPAQQWLDQHLNPTMIITAPGAHGVRKVGRLILSRSDNYNAVRNAIRIKMEALHSIDYCRGAPTVVLVAGISGGTGGGTVVDIAYMVRDVAADVFGGELGRSMDFYAILYTPEVLSDAPGIVSEVLHQNFTATMDEINAYFREPNVVKRYSFPRQGRPDGNLTNPTMGSERIFYKIALVQGDDPHSGRLSETDVIDATANYVLNLFGDYSDANSYHQFFPLAAQLFYCSRSSGYLTIRFKALTFPVEELMTILASRTMMALSEYFDKQPERNELKILGECNIAYVRRNPDNNAYEHASSRQRFDMLLRMAGVTQRKAENAVDRYPLEWRRVKGAVSIGEITREIPNISTQVATSRMDGHWKNDVLDNLFTELKEEMKENGPYAALRLCERMAAVIDSILTSKLDANSYITKQLTEAQEQVSAAFRAIKEAGIAANKRTLLDSFRTSLIRYWGWKNRSNLLETVFEILNELYHEVTARHRKVFSSYVGAFGAIAEVLSKDSFAEIATSTMTHGMSNLFSTSMLNIDDINNDNSVLAQFINHWLTPGNISRISANLIQNMLEHEEAWQVEQFDGVAQMKDVFKKQFAGFANKALQKMIVIANMEPPSMYGRTVDDILNAMDQTIDNKALQQNGIPLSDDQKWNLFNNVCANLGYPVGRDPITDAAKKIYDGASAIGQFAAFDTAYASEYDHEIKVLCLMADTPQLNAAITQISGVEPRIGNFPGVFHLNVTC